MSFPSDPSSGPRSSCCCIATTTCNLSRSSRNCQWSWAHLWDELLLETLPMLLDFWCPTPSPLPKEKEFLLPGLCFTDDRRERADSNLSWYCAKISSKAVGNICPPFLWAVNSLPFFCRMVSFWNNGPASPGSPFSEGIHCQGGAKASENLQKESMSRPEALQRPEPNKKTVCPPKPITHLSISYPPSLDPLQGVSVGTANAIHRAPQGLHTHWSPLTKCIF